MSADKTAIIKSTCVETSNQHRAFPSIPWLVKSRSMCVSDCALWTGAGNYSVAPENTKERPKLQSVIVSATKKIDCDAKVYVKYLVTYWVLLSAG